MSRRRPLAPLLGVTAAIGLQVACARKAVDDPCGPHHPARIEVRDGQGVLELVGRGATGDGGVGAGGATGHPAGLTLCDGGGRALGRLVEGGGRLTLLGPRGEELARAERRGGERTLERLAGGCAPGAPPAPLQPAVAATTGPPPCPRLRFYEGPGLLRLLDPQGVPLGQIATTAGGGPVNVLDPAGRVIALVERAEPQDDSRLAVRDPDGRTRLLLLGLRPERAAAALALPSLALTERLLLGALLGAPDDGGRPPGAAAR